MSWCGGYGYTAPVSNYGGGNTFVLIVVLFILLIIVGAAWC
ncbi:YjcZ family sporulation protein [Bacillus sp. HMF5848]|nr:YjcZ family sporulation protein [Bacillus sp. HMF5848]RSK25911.1 YjcZ family sporulation protein [Bacillus sp. HMF5848]